MNKFTDFNFKALVFGAAIIHLHLSDFYMQDTVRTIGKKEH